jgi:voltage-gated potassium channel
MLRQIFVAFILVSINVSIHATGMVALLQWVIRRRPRMEKKFNPSDGILLLIRFFAVIISLHLAEICAWAGFYTLWGGLENFETALYFSITSYTTIGYGDILLTPRWRLLGGIEGVTGVLMFGWSTGAIFAVASRLLAIQMERNKTSADPKVQS